MQNLPDGSAGRIVLITYCMSPVGGFEAQQAAFLADMRAKGGQLATAANVLPRLTAIAGR